MCCDQCSRLMLLSNKQLHSYFFLLKFPGLDMQAVPRDYEKKSNALVAVLFSGGLDSMILAAILDECLDTKCNWFLLFCF